jgi:hypothetical protein
MAADKILSSKNRSPGRRALDIVCLRKPNMAIPG